MEKLAGKVAFITGGGSGVALGQAKVLAEEAGMKVVIADLRQDAPDEAMAYFASRDAAVHAIRLDTTDRAAYARAAEEAEAVFGPVQLLFNTAGVSQFGPVEQATYDDWDRQIGVNLQGVINAIQTFQDIINALNAWRDHPDYELRMKLREEQGQVMPGT